MKSWTATHWKPLPVWLSGPTVAYGRVKELYERSWDSTLEEQLDAETEAFARTAMTRDFQEGITGLRRAPSTLVPGHISRGMRDQSPLRVGNVHPEGVTLTTIGRVPMTRSIYLANPYGFSAQQKSLLLPGVSRGAGGAGTGSLGTLPAEQSG